MSRKVTISFETSELVTLDYIINSEIANQNKLFNLVLTSNIENKEPLLENINDINNRLRSLLDRLKGNNNG